MVAPEVKMEGFGNVDFVIADVGQDGEVEQFLSVELQAIDITGSAFKAYQALRAGEDLEKKPTYGFNWDNVYKRYITQLIRKGYFHHHWKSKIVAVIPEQVYEYIKGRAGFMADCPSYGTGWAGGANPASGDNAGARRSRSPP